MDASVELACTNYRRYVELIFGPATRAFGQRLDGDGVRLHEVFGVNLFVAHAVDYIRAIRVADGISESRPTLIREFDEHFSVEGARFQNKKFELIDAVNNALKHIKRGQPSTHYQTGTLKILTMYLTSQEEVLV